MNDAVHAVRKHGRNILWRMLETRLYRFRSKNRLRLPTINTVENRRYKNQPNNSS